MLEKIKCAYTLWHACHELMPKTQKYSLGNRIDKLFIEILEAVSTAAFLPREEKIPWVRAGLRKIDVIQILLTICIDTKSFDEKHSISLAIKLAEIGKDLGGWNGKLVKENSARRIPAEK